MIPRLPINQLLEHCSSVHRNQQPHCFQQPQGGSEPLDFIYVFQSADDPIQGTPKHWHYVGIGLSDIYMHGLRFRLDKMERERNHIYAANTPPMVQLYPLPRHPDEKLNGFGFELTFRLKCDDEPHAGQEPPDWPTRMLQALSRYVFKSQNIFNVGDHAAWHRSLNEKEDSCIQHMLMTLDPQLGELEADLGKVKFIQIVGVCDEELQAARQLNVEEILKIMRLRPETGGPLLVTDMRRGEDIFQLDPDNRERIEHCIGLYGSNMAQISAKHDYSSSRPSWYDQVEDWLKDSSYYRAEYEYKPAPISPPPSYEPSNTTRNHSRMSYESESALLVENAEIVDTRFYDNIYLIMSRESAKVLPIAIKGRLAHGKPFSFQSFRGDLLTTFVPEGAQMDSLVGRDQPMARRGIWLQLFVSNELRQEMQETIGEDFSERNGKQQLALPKNYSFTDFRLYITVVERL